MSFLQKSLHVSKQCCTRKSKKASNRRTFLFRQSDSFKPKFDLLVMISAAFNCFSIPFKVAFNPPLLENFAFEVFNWFIDFIFLCDIIISFRLTYIDDYGHEEFRPRYIAINYLKGQFLLDVFATLPIDQIITAIVKKKN